MLATSAFVDSERDECPREETARLALAILPSTMNDDEH